MSPLFILRSKHVIIASIGVLPSYCTTLHSMHYAEMFLQPHGLPHWNESRWSTVSSATLLTSQISQSILSYFFSFTANLAFNIFYPKQSNWYWLLLVVIDYHRLIYTLLCVIHSITHIAPLILLRSTLDSATILPFWRRNYHMFPKYLYISTKSQPVILGDSVI